MPDDPVSFGLPFHPYADLFPLMEGQEFDDLVTDIEQNGLLHPIVLLDGKILDGRNRYRACLDAMVKIQTETYKGKEKPLDYVISVNLKRRHLNESQRAMVAARLADIQRGDTLKKGPRPANLQIGKTSQPDAAARLNVSPRSVADAKVVQDRGSPELISRVNQGDVAVSVASKVARMSPEKQAVVVGLPEPELRGAVKKAVRAEREKELAQATQIASASLGTKLYNVIYADPPWSFAPYSRETGMDRAADNHYPTMTTAEICALEVPASDDCALFLWATAPMLRDALQVMEAWGFAYKSHYVWVKDRVGTGYWARNKHELLLIGVKGAVPAPAPGDQFESVVLAAVGRHSEKPPAFAEMIEEMFPNASLLEMFARSPRAGWDVWGNQVKQKGVA